jgi:hypothetical protein
MNGSNGIFGQMLDVIKNDMDLLIAHGSGN